MNRAALASALAKAVAADLRGAIARRGQARLAVSGGSTPRAFLIELSKQTLDWAHVTVVPVDDRWVRRITRVRTNACCARPCFRVRRRRHSCCPCGVPRRLPSPHCSRC